MNIREIQKRLGELGFNPGPVDGVPGRLTTAAIAKFQRARGIDVQSVGTLEPETLAALFPRGAAFAHDTIPTQEQP